MPELTKEQSAAVEACGKIIVSASAGSGKTFVMIEKLVRAIERGADLDEVLAVTFTKKAAAQMKEKLRKALIERIKWADEKLKPHLKNQLSKVAGANISTIHSFCSRLLRIYFYALDIDGAFEIISEDDPSAKDLKSRAVDNLFERLYEEKDESFYRLLSCYVKKRSDRALKKLLLECYAKVRIVADYEDRLKNTADLYTEERFKEIYERVSEAYGADRKAFNKAVANEATERERFFESGKTAAAIAEIVLAFDREYASVKRDANKLDYNDLEHLTLKLLADEGLKEEINSVYKYVYVDEYQDVNPVQEKIISALGGEVFLVGDVKQAIYGFRGSRSHYFSQKYENFEGGKSLNLTSNFRSGKGVIDFVNKLFSKAMNKSVCDIGYASDPMTAGAPYPEDYGSAQIHIFGKEEKKKKEEEDVYSVIADSRSLPHTREGLAVVKIVRQELTSKHYDLKSGEYIDTQPGDICILTRKNKNESIEGIVRALKDAGYPVTGAQEGNICKLPEVKKMLDILSLIDNVEQDVPLVSALLSPLGGFTENELAKIRIAFKRVRERLSFRECCIKYAAVGRGEIAQKLNKFYGLLEELRRLSDILYADELIDRILGIGCYEASLCEGSGEKLKNVLKLASEAHVPLAAFLERVKAGEFDIAAPADAPSNSIKIMTMHASKGLEFPVVILADICRTFKGQDYEEIPYDEEFGFAPRYFDSQKMVVYNTALRRLVKLRADREELKNELNLFYVACTRAMCSLHILAEECVSFSEADAIKAKCYAKTFDMSEFDLDFISELEDYGKSAGEETLIYDFDKDITEQIESRFERAYPHANCIDLPVKSSASAILKQGLKEEPYYLENALYKEEAETGAEKGTAYHRFLELADFGIKTREGIEEEIENFVQSGRLLKSQRDLLNTDELVEILSMPVFKGLEGAVTYREQEFLCRLPANEIMDTDAGDGVLVQGAIDLLARGDFGVRIIDYKYSKKTDEQLINHYSPQLRLYKKAVSLILKIDESSIETAIVNIFSRRYILL